jgi:hypothetical protein
VCGKGRYGTQRPGELWAVVQIWYDLVPVFLFGNLLYSVKQFYIAVVIL